ncbi:MAG: DUF169 domain-containing protein [Chloroflexi bacterium]|nr:DUF169 domain-containing protein [Chloroflexota bacterium]
MDLKQLNEALNFYIRPQAFPVAMRLCQSAQELPPRVRIPTRDLHTTVTLCQGVGMARKFGWTLAIGGEDQVCPFGSLALGFVPPKKEWLDGSIAATTGHWTRESMARAAEELPRFDYGKYQYLLLAPLHTATFDPHLVAIYGNSAQVMRLVQGRVYDTGKALTSSTLGSADCADMIVRTVLSDECQVVLPCGGDRVFGLTQDDEMAFALPPSKMETVVHGLEAGHKSGLQRYPILAYLWFQPQMPPAYQKLMKFLSQE